MISKRGANASTIRSRSYLLAFLALCLFGLALAVGCTNKDAPEYWIDKLDDGQWRQKAVKRLDQFLQDAATKDSNSGLDASRPGSTYVGPLVNKIIEPLVRVYDHDYDAMDTDTRIMTLRLIAACKDKRAEPALRKAMNDFIARPPTKADEQEIKWALRAQGDLKLPSLSAPLLGVFQKFEAHTALGAAIYKDLNDAMLAAPDKAWTSSLESLLGTDMAPPDPKNQTTVEQYRDQLFRQTVAAQLLGELQNASSVTPLMKVVLDPAKSEVAVTALMALVKIGKPAVDKAVLLLTGKAKDLADFHVQRLMKFKHLDRAPPDAPEVQVAATILGTIGRAEAFGPMRDLLQSTHDAPLKAVLLREIAKLPPSRDSKAAFEQAFATLSLDTQMPSSGRPALTQLVENSVVRFHDAAMVDWLLKRVRTTKGDPADKKDFQAAVLSAALKLATADQLDELKQAVQQYGTPDPESKKKAPNVWWSGYFEGPMYESAEQLLKSCADKWPCYLSRLEGNPTSTQDRAREFTRIKAAYMLAAYGNKDTAGHIVRAMGYLDDPDVRAEAAQTIDFLVANGSTKVADQLDAIIERHEKSGDAAKIAGDTALRQVMYRIRSRAL